MKNSGYVTLWQSCSTFTLTLKSRVYRPGPGTVCKTRSHPTPDRLSCMVKSVRFPSVSSSPLSLPFCLCPTTRNVPAAHYDALLWKWKSSWRSWTFLSATTSPTNWWKSAKNYKTTRWTLKTIEILRLKNFYLQNKVSYLQLPLTSTSTQQANHCLITQSLHSGFLPTCFSLFPSCRLFPNVLRASCQKRVTPRSSSKEFSTLCRRSWRLRAGLLTRLVNVSLNDTLFFFPVHKLNVESKRSIYMVFILRRLLGMTL